MRTIKEDIVWCYDWDNPFDFEIALNKWINNYNTDYPHQALHNLTPKEYFGTYLNKEPVLT
jgi:transposase InsO family protein